MELSSLTALPVNRGCAAKLRSTAPIPVLTLLVPASVLRECVSRPLLRNWAAKRLTLSNTVTIRKNKSPAPFPHRRSYRQQPMPNTRFAVSSYLTSSFPLLLARKARMLGLQLNSLAGKSTSRVRPRLVKVRKPQLVKKTGMKHEGQEDPAAELYWLRHQKGQEGSDSHRSDTGWGHCP